jgi:hypothetical protein
LIQLLNPKSSIQNKTVLSQSRPSLYYCLKFPAMNEIQIGLNTYETPESWEDVSREQSIDIAWALINSSTIQDFKSRLMLRWLKMEAKIYTFKDRIYTNQGSKRKTPRLHRQGKAMFISPEDWFLICETLNWMFAVSPKNKNPFFQSRLTTNPVPVIKNGNSRLFGPENLLSDCSAIEFAKADTRRISFRNTTEEKYLNELIALLYRPRRRFRRIARLITGNYNTDPRVKYSDAYLKNADIIAKLPSEIRHAILIWFEGCCTVMAERYNAVFSGGESTDDSTGWAGVFQRIADKATEINSVMELNIHTLLFDLNERIKQSKETGK